MNNSRKKQHKILVVDDDIELRSFMQAALEHYGFEPVAVESGPSALEVLRKTSDISLVILDWMMPGMDGLETLENIQKLLSPPPVIMLTAKTGKNSVLDAIRAGVIDYITKPINIGRFILRLNRLIEKIEGEQEKTSEDEKSETRLGIRATSAFVIRDISCSGVCIESSFPVDQDSVVFLESAEISSRLHLDEDYCFLVRVANCVQKGKKYRIGAQFIELPDYILERLKDACSSPTAFRFNP